MKIECYVLNTGQRIFVSSAFLSALYIQNGQKSHRTRMKDFLARIAINTSLNKELATGLADEIRFRRPGKGGSPAVGFRAELLPAICAAIVYQGQTSTSFSIQYFETITRATKLMEAFSTVGIIALVDEVTGYEKIRKEKLHEILDRYLLPRHAEWAKRFPDSFYEAIFKLRGWTYDPSTVSRPAVIGRYTREIVYARLAPGILAELEERNPPKTAAGNRSVKHHQFLTDDVGHPSLQEHLVGVIALMRAATNWNDFQRMLARVYPVFGEQHLLDLYRDFDGKE